MLYDVVATIGRRDGSSFELNSKEANPVIVIDGNRRNQNILTSEKVNVFIGATNNPEEATRFGSHNKYQTIRMVNLIPEEMYTIRIYITSGIGNIMLLARQRTLDNEVIAEQEYTSWGPIGKNKPFEVSFIANDVAETILIDHNKTPTMGRNFASLDYIEIETFAPQFIPKSAMPQEAKPAPPPPAPAPMPAPMPAQMAPPERRAVARPMPARPMLAPAEPMPQVVARIAPKKKPAWTKWILPGAILAGAAILLLPKKDRREP